MGCKFWQIYHWITFSSYILHFCKFSIRSNINSYIINQIFKFKFLQSKMYIKNKFMDRVVNNIWMTWNLCERPRPWPVFMMLGQTHMNGWSRVVVSQNRGSTSYIFPFRLGVLQWSRHLFNYWKNKKTIIEKFLILLIWNLIYIDHRKITGLWS